MVKLSLFAAFLAVVMAQSSSVLSSSSSSGRPWQDYLDIVVDVLLVLSIVGAFLTILTFTIFRDIRTYPIKLIIFLCFCIFFSQVFFWASFDDTVFESLFCIPMAMTYHYFFLANFFWTFCIAFNFYQMIVRRNRDAEALEKWYHLASWSIPAIFVIGIAASKNYGNLGTVCYMDNATAVFTAFFLPGLIIVSANAVIFFFIAREIHDTLASAPKSDKSEKRKEFRVYLSIFISIGLSWIFGFIMTLFNEDDPTQKVFLNIFLVLFSVTTPLQGFLIFASYCFNAKVAARWAGLFGKCLPFCRRWEHLGSSTTSGTSGTSGTSSSASSRL